MVTVVEPYRWVIVGLGAILVRVGVLVAPLERYAARVLAALRDVGNDLVDHPGQSLYMMGVIEVAADVGRWPRGADVVLRMTWAGLKGRVLGANMVRPPQWA
ncbi:hypothetical protein BHE74_00046504 [Ensete ventricosum]|nr:hypothetical protein BHE74_00046504 [Ensete ventricosum]RZS24815.1 hypothetical protein BHM03_00057931 [Ensete ventricosum]